MRPLQIFFAVVITGNAVWAVDVSHLMGRNDIESSVLAKRQQTIINPPCPEKRGKSPQKCSECGGDSKRAGVCDDINPQGRQDLPSCWDNPGHVCGEHCRCIPEADDSDGDGDGGNTVPFPIIPPGFPPAIPPGVPNPLAPKDGKEVCEGDYSKRKCNECEGNSGWCTKGDDVGCPCREDCPADDKRDKCSDEDCKGEDDGKCTIGLHKDCKCKNECPSEGDEPFCHDDNCKANDDKDECTTGEHKGCNCFRLGEATVHIHHGNSAWLDEQQEILRKFKAMPDYEPDSDDSDETDEKAKCKMTGGTGVVGDDFIKARDAFCKDPSKDYDKDLLEFALKRSDGDCPKDDCVKSLNQFWNACGEYHSRPSPLDDESLSEHHGPLQGSGEFTGKCGKYTFKKSDPPPEFKPPGEDAKDPEGYRNEIQCAMQEKRMSVKKEDYEATVEKFCKDGRDLKNRSSATELKDLGDASLELRGQGWGSHNPESHLYYQDQDACRGFDAKIREDDCKKVLGKIYDKCDPEGKKSFVGGVYVYNCVFWTVYLV